jgi:threonine dehydrogenase-like Zn-dependent dehydrogenase
VLLGLHDNETPLPSHEIVRREITVTGSFTYTPKDVRRALALLAAQRVRFDTWTTSRPLTEGATAFADLLRHPGPRSKVFLCP